MGVESVPNDVADVPAERISPGHDNTNSIRRDSSGSVSSRSFDVQLIHSRLPKQVINIQVRNPTVVTPSPVPINPIRSQQLRNILEPCNLALLREADDILPSKILEKHDPASKVQILQALLDENPEVTSLADLYLEDSAVQENRFQSGIVLPHEILEKTHRNYLKTQTEDQSADGILKLNRANRLSKILESVRILDASIPLRKNEWIQKPRTGTAKKNLEARWKLQRKLRKQIASGRYRTRLPGSSGSHKMSEAESHSILDDSTDSSPKKSVPTKAQLKQISKKKSSKSRHRVLVLQRKYKIRPGTLFKCRRTREKFTFTSAHRTITESALSLLTAGYAIKGGAIQAENQKTNVQDCKASNEEVKLPSSIPLNCSLRELAQLYNTSASIEPDFETSAQCRCQQPRVKNKKSVPDLSAVPERKFSPQHPSMVLVDHYTMGLKNSSVLSPRSGIFDHTIELLAYARELEQKFRVLKTENVLLDIRKRPVLDAVTQNPLGEVPLPTLSLEKKYLKEALSYGVSDVLAHSGFTQSGLGPIEVLSEVLSSYYEKLATNLKAVMEKEVAGISHGFLDPMDRVATELGLGGVRGLGDYYEHHVIGYHKNLEQTVDKLENKLGTLMAYKVRGDLDSSSSTPTTPSVGSGAGNRILKPPSSVREYQTFPTTCDVVSSSDSKVNSMEMCDLTLNLQIDSIPSIGSI